jgi:hypothetical protein
MAGGVITPYARLRGVPVLHTVHNTHTGHVPLDMFYGVNLRALWDMLYLSDTGARALDCQATAIRNATKVSYVGGKFPKEIVGDYFLHEMVIPWSVRVETKARYYGHDALVIPNGISPDAFPENQRRIRRSISRDWPGGTIRPRVPSRPRRPTSQVPEEDRPSRRSRKRSSLLASRLDPSRRGRFAEPIAQRFVDANPGVQIAVVGDPVGGDNYHADVMGRIACASGGRISYQRFSQDLSTLGYAAATDVFGASLYEPFGQIDVVGNIYGAMATNRDTGGYSDKIVSLNLRAWGAPIDQGNGVLFRDYNAGGLWDDTPSRTTAISASPAMGKADAPGHEGGPRHLEHGQHGRQVHHRLRRPQRRQTARLNCGFLHDQRILPLCWTWHSIALSCISRGHYDDG